MFVFGFTPLIIEVCNFLLSHKGNKLYKMTFSWFFSPLQIITDIPKPGQLRPKPEEFMTSNTVQITIPTPNSDFVT